MLLLNPYLVDFHISNFVSMFTVHLVHCAFSSLCIQFSLVCCYWYPSPADFHKYKCTHKTTMYILMCNQFISLYNEQLFVFYVSTPNVNTVFCLMFQYAKGSGPYCYRVIAGGQPLSYTDANDWCGRVLNGTLATINDRQVLYSVTQNKPNHVPLITVNVNCELLSKVCGHQHALYSSHLNS